MYMTSITFSAWFEVNFFIVLLFWFVSFFFNLTAHHLDLLVLLVMVCCLWNSTSLLCGNLYKCCNYVPIIHCNKFNRIFLVCLWMLLHFLEHPYTLDYSYLCQLSSLLLGWFVQPFWQLNCSPFYFILFNHHMVLLIRIQKHLILRWMRICDTYVDH